MAMLTKLWAPPVRGVQLIGRPSQFGFRRRRAEKFLLPLLRDIYNKRGAVRIADLGGAVTYWTNDVGGRLLEQFNCNVQLINIDTAYFGASADHPRIALAKGDVCSLSMPDQSFDLAHSNSVIEHVGDWTRMRAMANEIRRIAPVYLVQTPYFWFPIEPHFRAPFFHWLPEQLRARLLTRMAMGAYERIDSFDEAMFAVQHVQLIDRTQMRTLFPDAQIEAERLGGFIKSITAIRRSTDQQAPNRQTHQFNEPHSTNIALPQ